MLSRRLFAFRENARRLIEKEGRLYLWTFTLPSRMEPRYGAKKWNNLLHSLRKHVPDWSGIRVFERHPGGGSGFLSFIPGAVQSDESHGLHVHFLCSRFYDISLVLNACKRSGWGRVHVVRVRGGKEGKRRAADYLAKYLHKKRHPSMKGIRLVGHVNMPEKITLRDVLITGHTKDLWDAAKDLPGWHSLNFFGKAAAVQWLNQRTLMEGGSPAENMVEMLDNLAASKQRERWSRLGMPDPRASGDRLLQLRDLGVFEEADLIRNQRFIAKKHRLPVSSASLLHN